MQPREATDHGHLQAARQPTPSRRTPAGLGTRATRSSSPSSEAARHSLQLTRPVPGMAEHIEAVERQGWRMNQFTSFPVNNNIAIVALFRRVDALVPLPAPVDEEVEEDG